MGIMLYGMFLAIVIPAARESRGSLLVAVLAAGLSTAVYYFLSELSSGFSVIICAVIASAAGAVLHPVEEEEA